MSSFGCISHHSTGRSWYIGDSRLKGESDFNSVSLTFLGVGGHLERHRLRWVSSMLKESFLEFPACQLHLCINLSCLLVQNHELVNTSDLELIFRDLYRYRLISMRMVTYLVHVELWFLSPHVLELFCRLDVLFNLFFVHILELGGHHVEHSYSCFNL